MKKETKSEISKFLNSEMEYLDTDNSRDIYQTENLEKLKMILSVFNEAEITYTQDKVKTFPTIFYKKLLHEFNDFLESKVTEAE